MEQMSLFSLPDSQKRGSLGSLFFYKGHQIDLIRKPYYYPIQLKVLTHGKAQVCCATHTSFHKIQEFIEQHELWLSKQLVKYRNLKKKYPLKTFKQGESFLFQGKKLSLVYRHTKKSVPGFYKREKKLCYQWNKMDQLNYFYMKKKLFAFYKTEAKNLISHLIEKWSRRMRLFPKSVTLRSQKTLWGSCSAKGCLSLNWRLIGAPPAVLEYIVIHELAHLKYRDHSPTFWSYVSLWDHAYRKREKWLGNQSYCLDFLLPRSELHDK